MAGKKELSNEDKKEIAYDLYMNTNLSQKEICTKVKITPATFTSWKQKYDWEIHKQAHSITAQNIVSNLLQRGLALSLDPKATSDSILKNAKSIEILSGAKVSVSNVMNVFKEFTTWAMSEDSENAKIINKLQKQFVDYKISAN